MLYDSTSTGWGLSQTEKKGVTMLLYKCLGSGTESSLQIAQFRYHIAQLLYPSCFSFASESDPCLYNLTNTSKTRGAPYSWQLRWCLTSQSQSKLYWAFSPRQKSRHKKIMDKIWPWIHDHYSNPPPTALPVHRFDTHDAHRLPKPPALCVCHIWIPFPFTVPCP